MNRDPLSVGCEHFSGKSTWLVGVVSWYWSNTFQNDLLSQGKCECGRETSWTDSSSSILGVVDDQICTFHDYVKVYIASCVMVKLVYRRHAGIRLVTVKNWNGCMYAFRARPRCNHE